MLTKQSKPRTRDEKEECAMSEKLIGVKLEVTFDVFADKTYAMITLRKTEEDIPAGVPHKEAVTATGKPEMAARILGGRIKQAVIDGMFMFT